MTTLSPKQMARLQRLHLSPLGLLSDALLWMLLLAGVVALGGVILGWWGPRTADRQVIKLSFNDANEVQPGCVVRMMGVDVGFVTQVALREDHVEITLEISPDSPKVPHGSRATVLFNGLVGAKSLEFVPPDPPQPPPIKGMPGYLVENPIRLREALEYNIDIAKSLQTGAENLTRFFGKEHRLEAIEENLHFYHRYTASGIGTLNRFEETLARAHREVRHATAEATDTLNDLALAAREVNQMMGQHVSKSDVTEGLRYSRYWLDEVDLGIQQLDQDKLLSGWNRKQQSLQQTLLNQSIHWQDWAEAWPCQVDQPLQRLNDRLENVQQGISPQPSAPLQSRLKKAPEQLRRFNQRLDRWNQGL
ncbi:MAG: MlaD family protein [Candidatus Melainabacteria bacterium]|nr:MlaD family protein [Candidatus Melainabacteria bacterium]